jgi:hypothetical protein
MFLSIHARSRAATTRQHMEATMPCEGKHSTGKETRQVSEPVRGEQSKVKKK